MAWYNASWTKRKPITLTGGSSGAQTDYQVKITVTYDTDMQVDFDDLRFTESDGTTLLNSWLESKVDSTSAIVWVETNTPANTVEATIYMYYGNSGVSSAWDIGDTFIFGDDFMGWDKSSDNPVLSEYTGGTRFDDGYVYRAQIIKNGTNDYYMYYCGGHDAIVDHRDNIGLAKSSDLINWTRFNGSETENAIITHGASGKFDYNRAWGPGTVIRESATSWKMWYTGDSTLGTPHACSIGYATSTDGESWTKYAGSETGDAIFVDAAGGAQVPTVVKVSDTDYRMLYAIYGTSNIKYATSSNGISWTIQNSGNAVITGETSPTSLIKIDSTYYLWTQTSPYKDIKVFTSTDCISWTDKGVQLTSASSGYDTLSVYWGRVFEDTSGHWVMTYTGVQTAVTTDCRICYATLDRSIPVVSSLSKWTTGGTPIISDGQLELADDDNVYTINDYGYGYALRTNVKANEQDSVFIRLIDSGATNSLGIYNSDSISNNVFDSITTHSNNAGVSNIVTTPSLIDFRTNHLNYEIIRISGNVSYYQNDTLIRSETNSTYLPTVDLLGSIYVWDSSQESTLWCDWAFIRKYVTNPSSSAFGGEESAPTGWSGIIIGVSSPARVIDVESANITSVIGIS